MVLTYTIWRFKHIPQKIGLDSCLIEINWDISYIYYSPAYLFILNFSQRILSTGPSPTILYGDPTLWYPLYSLKRECYWSIIQVNVIYIYSISSSFDVPHILATSSKTLFRRVQSGYFADTVKWTEFLRVLQNFSTFAPST